MSPSSTTSAPRPAAPALFGRFTDTTTLSAPSELKFRGSITLPARAPTDAWPPSSRTVTHGSGSRWSFLVGVAPAPTASSDSSKNTAPRPAGALPLRLSPTEPLSGDAVEFDRNQRSETSAQRRLKASTGDRPRRSALAPQRGSWPSGRPARRCVPPDLYLTPDLSKMLAEATPPPRSAGQQLAQVFAVDVTSHKMGYTAGASLRLHSRV